jgi:hypothetical protein
MNTGDDCDSATADKRNRQRWKTALPRRMDAKGRGENTRRGSRQDSLGRRGLVPDERPLFWFQQSRSREKRDWGRPVVCCEPRGQGEQQQQHHPTHQSRAGGGVAGESSAAAQRIPREATGLRVGERARGSQYGSRQRGFKPGRGRQIQERGNERQGREWWCQGGVEGWVDNKQRRALCDGSATGRQATHGGRDTTITLVSSSQTARADRRQRLSRWSSGGGGDGGDGRGGSRGDERGLRARIHRELPKIQENRDGHNLGPPADARAGGLLVGGHRQTGGQSSSSSGPARQLRHRDGDDDNNNNMGCGTRRGTTGTRQGLQQVDTGGKG